MPDLLQTLGDAPGRFALACLAAFLASILGGLAGFGTGLVLPAFVAPIVGVRNVVPVMAVAMLFNNGGRAFAFRRDIAWPQAGRMLALGLPACLAGAWAYTLLPTRAIGVLLGGFLLAAVVLRRMSARWHAARASPAVQIAAGGGFGFINGGLTGAGVILIAILMSAGLAGPTLIATDAIVSLVMGLAKVALFGRLEALDLSLALTGLALGLCTVPGAFVARALLHRIPARIHAGFMEAVVVVGAFWMLVQALR